MVVPVQNPTVMGYFEPAVKSYSDVVFTLNCYCVYEFKFRSQLLGINSEEGVVGAAKPHRCFKERNCFQMFNCGNSFYG